MSNLIEIKDLKISFTTKDSLIQAVDNISFSLHEGEILGIVGESGSGKSVTALSILRLLSSNATIANGSILFKNENLPCFLFIAPKRPAIAQEQNPRVHVWAAAGLLPWRRYNTYPQCCWRLLRACHRNYADAQRRPAASSHRP